MAQRPLTPTEALIWQLDRAASLNFCTLLKVEGLNADALRAGLDALQARHPALRLRIERDGPSFVPCELKIPLRISSDPYLAELERELMQRFDSASGPLMRAVWISETQHLLLTFQHCVGDGGSGVIAANDLLRAAAGYLRGQAPQLEPLARHVSAEECLPPKLRGLRFLTALATHGARAKFKALRLGEALRSPELHVPFDERQLHVLEARFEAQQVEPWLARARREGTTLHGLLGAVHMQAMAAQSGARVLRFASPVGLRGLLDAPLSEAIGCYVGSSNARLAVDPSASPWPLARALRRSVARDVANGVCMLPQRFGARAYRHFTRGGAPPELVGQRLHALRGSCGLTNLGRVELQGNLSPLIVRELSFAVAMSCLGDQLATATTFGGRLHWNLCCASPSVPAEPAREMWADAGRRLSACLSQ